MSGLLFMSCADADTVSEVIPQPSVVRYDAGCFTFSSQTCIYVKDKSQEEVADWFAWNFARPAGFVPRIVHNESEADVILRTDCEMKSEAYAIKVTPKSIEILASGTPGFFYAFQTLIYSLPESIHSSSYVHRTKWSVPSMTVYDEPRFSHRCLNVNISGVSIYRNRLYQLMDNMALLKFNVLHLNMDDGCPLSEQELYDLALYASTLQISLCTDGQKSKGSDLLVSFANRSLMEIYFYEPDEHEDFHSFLMGLLSCSWLESCSNRDDLRSKLFPRMAALAEISWSPEGSKDWMRFSKAAQSCGRRMNFMF